MTRLSCLLTEQFPKKRMHDLTTDIRFSSIFFSLFFFFISDRDPLIILASCEDELINHSFHSQILYHKIAAIRLRTGNSKPSGSNVIASFQGLRDTWHNRLLTPVASPGTFIVGWIPGHAGITGNARADSLAKSACNESTLRITASISRAARLLNERNDANIISCRKIQACS